MQWAHVSRPGQSAESVSLKDSFIPYTEAHLSAKPKTVDYYRYGIALLLKTGMGGLVLNQISSQHAAGYIAKHAKRSIASLDCRTRCARTRDREVQPLT